MQGHLNLEVICRSDQSLTGPVTRPLLGARVLLGWAVRQSARPGDQGAGRRQSCYL